MLMGWWNFRMAWEGESSLDFARVKSHFVTFQEKFENGPLHEIKSYKDSHASFKLSLRYHLYNSCFVKRTFLKLLLKSNKTWFDSIAIVVTALGQGLTPISLRDSFQTKSQPVWFRVIRNRYQWWKNMMCFTN